MNEPCKHERAIGNALTSLAASDAAMEMATAELLAKDATIGRLDEDVAGWISRAVDAEATLAKVRTIVADPHAALVVDRVRAALEATS